MADLNIYFLLTQWFVDGYRGRLLYWNLWISLSPFFFKWKIMESETEKQRKVVCEMVLTFISISPLKISSSFAFLSTGQFWDEKTLAGNKLITNFYPSLYHSKQQPPGKSFMQLCYKFQRTVCPSVAWSNWYRGTNVSQAFSQAVRISSNRISVL